MVCIIINDIFRNGLVNNPRHDLVDHLLFMKPLLIIAYLKK